MSKIPSENNLIIDKTFAFAVAILNFSQKLEHDKNFISSNQLLKSGTSIGANAREAQNAESKADFIHKFKVAAKEADETEYWLLLCQALYNNDANCLQLLEDVKIIQKILTKIIATSKNPLSNKQID